MTIYLPEDLERYVQERVLNGDFASQDEAITEAVRLLRRAEVQPPQSQTDSSASLASQPQILKPSPAEAMSLDTFTEVWLPRWMSACSQKTLPRQ